MTATYTANLASLLVDRKPPPINVETMEDVVARGYNLCTYANTGMDQYIQRQHRNVKRVPLPSELATYDALHEGLCDLTVSYQQNWLGFAKNRTYNPNCDLAWVGRTIRRIESGFAVNADAGYLCSSLIRDVLNIYMEEMFTTDYIADLWDAEYAKTQDIFCTADRSTDGQDFDDRRRRRRRQLQVEEMMVTQRQQRLLETFTTTTNTASTGYNKNHRMDTQRKLKAGGRSGAAAVGGSTDSSEESERLTLKEMAGTFILHYACSIIAIVVGYLAQPTRKTSKKLVKRSFRSLSQTFKKTPSSSIASNLPNTADPCKVQKDGDEYDSGETSSSSCAVQRTQKELEETKQELYQTRHELGERMDLIVSMLTNMQKEGGVGGDGGGQKPERHKVLGLF
jgi:hypothetical protein